MPIGVISSADLLAGVFVILLGWSSAELFRAGSGVRGRIDCLWHVAMSAAMLIMVAVPAWPIPAMLSTLVFGTGAVWFAGAAMVRRGRAASAGSVASWGHAVMCASMVAMAWAMDPLGHDAVPTDPASTSSASDGHTHHGGAVVVDGAAFPQAWIQLWCLINAAILLWVEGGMLAGFVVDARRAETLTPRVGPTRALALVRIQAPTVDRAAAQVRPTPGPAGPRTPPVLSDPSILASGSRTDLRAIARLVADLAMAIAMAVACAQMI